MIGARAVAVASLVACVVASGSAQRPRTDAAPDSIGRRPPPFNYFARSLLLPGWGQASLDRHLTAALFIGVEGLALSMALKAGNELPYLERTDTALASSRRAERQDWFVVLAFNHLFSALEAYVSAHLADFPRDLHLRAFPGRRPGLGVSIGHLP